MSNGKRILVVGGTGFIGRRVAERFAQLGHRVTVYHRGTTEGRLPASVEHIHSQHASIPALHFPEDLTPDIVVHMVAMGKADAEAAHARYRGRVERMVWISSGDVYAAYGRFIGTEPGPVDNSLLMEESPLRSVHHPYPEHPTYEKIFVERVALSDPDTPATVLRLPKVYGPGSNADLATVYGFRNQPQWRWTHGYVENVAAGIVLAALHTASANCIYNLGEAYTPTMAERLAQLPPSDLPLAARHGNFEQNIAYDTGRIRSELGYQEPVPEEEAMRLTLANPRDETERLELT